MDERVGVDGDQRIVQIVRIARGLEEQLGTYAGRIWWAAAYSLLIRETHDRGVPRDRGGTVAEMDQVLGMLRDADLDADLLAALERTRTLVGAGETVGWDEFEHVLVCRHCGAFSAGKRKADCPSCGAGWITRKAFQPIWFLKPLDPSDVLQTLESTPARMQEIMDGLPEASLRERPSPEEWSLREVLEHLWLAQGLMQGRIQRMLEENSPDFAGVEVATAGSADEATAGLLEEFDDRRRALLSTLSSSDRKAWSRGGLHGEFGRITVQSQASFMARHEHFHLRQMRDVRQSLSA